ncbi:PqqD family peptide modification chaperone [Burkholderia metallica]|uniref:PqqD family peptide modification chaperone n=1 Tax=Burkholderia metallica TaxID=488729 RepID=UPI001CF4BCCA|nr:PqqD family peptide modification chaperone [Burkholderia metallica]MCA8003502.1 PqqD family peptide modification chaperone [Burkholderia metallica]
MKSNGCEDYMNLQAVPLKVDSVEIHRDAHPYGASAVLKNTLQWTYFTLSGTGVAIWDQIDGVRSVDQICRSICAIHANLTSADVVRCLSRLCGAGFVGFSDVQSLNTKYRNIKFRLTNPFVWEIYFSSLQVVFEKLYRSYASWIFSIWVMLLAILLGVTGVVAYGFSDLGNIFPHTPTPTAVSALIVSTFVTVLIHETMHGLAMVHFGRQVGGGGIGWFWFCPVPFIDTSDIWLGSRRQRLIVTLAGPLVEFVFAGTASIIALFCESGSDIHVLLRLFSAACYFRLIVNMCPFLEYDGYFVLCDVINEANIRRNSLVWFRSAVLRLFAPGALRVRGRVLYYVYSMCSVVYLISWSALMMFETENFVNGFSIKYLSASQAHVFSWIVAASFAMLIVFNAFKDVVWKRGGWDRVKVY